jgi:hypothetical protein
VRDAGRKRRREHLIPQSFMKPSSSKYRSMLR